MIRGHKLQRFVTAPLVPPRSTPGVDPVTGDVNPEFLDWEQQDALICTWLLSTISDSLLPKLVDCTYSWQMWSEVHRYFNTLLTTKARQLRSELRNLTKGSRTITEFVVRVREISESLVSIGDHVPHCNLIEVVLDALPEEYNPIVAAMNSKEDLCSLDELESSLLAHESRIEKNRKVVLTESVTVNLTQVSPPSAPPSTELSGVDLNPNFPTGTSHVTSNSEIMVMVHAVVVMVVVMAVPVVVEVDLGRFHARYVINLDMMPLYATTDTLIQVLLPFPHQELPSILT